jgi:hypothetical protein
MSRNSENVHVRREDMNLPRQKEKESKLEYKIFFLDAYRKNTKIERERMQMNQRVGVPGLKSSAGNIYIGIHE